MHILRSFFVLLVSLVSCSLAQAAEPTAPRRSEGEGPWDQLIIRGATLINGTLAPPMGPVDIVVEKNRITSIQPFHPGVAIDPAKRPQLKPGGKEIDATGMFILPGFVDTHVHYVGSPHNFIGDERSTEYIFKLWMAHGVTTAREVSCYDCTDTGLALRDQANRNEVTAPRLKVYLRFGRGKRDRIATVEEARQWVRENAKLGADGIKFSGGPPEVMRAAVEENAKLGLRSAIHAQQINVGRWNILDSARAGINSMEHWYGLPESMFDDRTVQHYSLDYNYQNEQDRFGEAGVLWKQAAAPFSDKWNAVMNELISLDFSLSPTFRAYLVNRDVMAQRRADWHEEYTMPKLWDFYAPSRVNHGSYWHSWGTEQEVAWRENFRLWMAFVNEYKNRGGRVTVGTDSGYLYNLYGFGFISEMELLREAGFHPLEVIKAATMNGAELMGMGRDIGSIDIGKLADFVLVEENPLENLQVLYGTGAIRLSEDSKAVRTKGIKYTVKDGIVYDARQMLADVRQMVGESKKRMGNYEITQPGIEKTSSNEH